MKKLNKQMAVSDLSEKTGTPVSTIKYYIREGLIPKPVKTSGTRGYYTIKHLDRIKLIKKLQKEGLTLSKIKDIIQMVDSGREREIKEKEPNKSDHRVEIIDSAISLFRQKGFGPVTITDIVSAANIGCSTFYKNFKNKKDLFMECIQKIIYDESNLNYPSSIENENDILAVFNKETELSLKQDPLWRDMISILRTAAADDPAEFANKLDEALQQKTDLFKQRIEYGIKLGYIREVDKTLLAVMVLGIQEACSEHFSKKEYTDARIKEMAAGVMDIMLHGILNK